MPRTIIPIRPSREPMSWLARKPAIAPTTIHASRPIRYPLRGSGWLATEDRDAPIHDQLEDRPANEGGDRSDIEDRARGMEGISPEDSLEREDEQLADAEDGRDEAIRFARVEQEQNDTKADEDLDESEDEDDDSPRRLRATGLRLADVVALGADGLLTGPGWRLGDNRSVD